MKTVNMHEAKTHLSRLVEEAAAGEEIIIARAGEPLARLVGIAASQTPRKLGALSGLVHESDDTWTSENDVDGLCW